jgi:hypothetical protein
MQEVIASPLSKAEENCLTIAGLVKRLHYDFLELGGLLLENQASAFWGASGAESFKSFVQQLGISYDWATRLMGVAKTVIENVFTKEQVVEIGVAKVCLLLPHIKKGKLPEEIKLLARDCTFQDLRLALKHDIIEGREQGDEIYCPRCGVRLYGLQFSSPLHQVSLNE